MEVQVGNQQKDKAMESKLVSKTTTKIVNLDHMKEFQEWTPMKLVMGTFI